MSGPVRGRMLVVLAAGLAMSCSGGTTAPTSPSGTNTFSGAIDGAPFVASNSAISATPSDAGPGSLSISGTEGANGTFRTVLLRLGFLSGPGVYPLGVSQSTTPGGIVELLTGQNGFISSFTTPLSGVAGSVTIASLKDLLRSRDPCRASTRRKIGARLPRARVRARARGVARGGGFNFRGAVAYPRSFLDGIGDRTRES